MNVRKVRLGIVLGPHAPIQNQFEHWNFDVEDIYFRPVLRGILTCVAGKPVEPVYAFMSPDEFLSSFRPDDFDGLIILWIGLRDLSAFPKLQTLSVPYVAVGTSSLDSSGSPLPCIDAANRDGGRMAARHLIGLGHRKLACVNLATSLVNHCDRMQGFEEAAAETGLVIESQHLLLDPGYAYDIFRESTAEWIGKLKQSGDLPTAIFACDYNMAEACLAALDQHRVPVPDRVSLIGFDDSPQATRLVPPLTTIRQPAYLMGFRAAQRVLDAIERPNASHAVTGSEVVPTELVIRQSTSTPPRN
ncbi:MAG: LacI family DNA-binding transcriptional regulator [Capsulimonadaceae bacterium]